MEARHIMKVLEGKIRPNVIFLGCLSADEVGRIKLSDLPRHKSVVFIANILSNDSPNTMGHWTAFHILDNSIYFFDSFALSPKLYSPYFRHFIMRHVHYNIFKLGCRLQSDNSMVCGVYCIEFVYKVSLYGIDYVKRYISKRYSSSSYTLNDAKVLQYAYRTFNMPKYKPVFCNTLNYKQCIAMFNNGK